MLWPSPTRFLKKLPLIPPKTFFCSLRLTSGYLVYVWNYDLKAPSCLWPPSFCNGPQVLNQGFQNSFQIVPLKELKNAIVSFVLFLLFIYNFRISSISTSPQILNLSPTNLLKLPPFGKPWSKYSKLCIEVTTSN